MAKRALQITASALPEDVRKAIIERQTEAMRACNCQISQETAIFKIIREWTILKAGGSKPGA